MAKPGSITIAGPVPMSTPTLNGSMASDHALSTGETPCSSTHAISSASSSSTPRRASSTSHSEPSARGAAGQILHARRASEDRRRPKTVSGLCAGRSDRRERLPSETHPRGELLALLLSDDQLERRGAGARRRVRGGEARLLEQLDGPVRCRGRRRRRGRCAEPPSPRRAGPAAARNRPSTIQPPGRIARTAPAAHPRAPTRRGRTSGPTRSRRRRHRRGRRRLWLRSVMRSSSPACVTLARAALERRLPHVDADDRRLGPDAGGRDREQADTGADVEHRVERRRTPAARGDERRHHHRAAAPAVEDHRVGVRPAGRPRRVVEQVESRARDACGRVDATIICCGGASSSRSPSPAASRTPRSAAAISGGADCPDVLRGRVRRRAPASASSAVCQRLTNAPMISSNDIVAAPQSSRPRPTILPRRGRCAHPWNHGCVAGAKTGAVRARSRRATGRGRRGPRGQSSTSCCARCGARGPAAGSCILLVGEGGVGKTRLLGEAAVGGPPARARRAHRRARRSRRRSRSVSSPRRCGRGCAAPGARPRCRRSTADCGSSCRSGPAPARRAPELSAAQLRLLALEGIVQLVRDIAADERRRRRAARRPARRRRREHRSHPLPRDRRDRRRGCRRRAASGRGDAPRRARSHAAARRRARGHRARPRSTRAPLPTSSAALLDARTAASLSSPTSWRAPTASRCWSRKCSTRTCARARFRSAAAGTSWRGGTIGVPKTVRGHGRSAARTPHAARERDVLVAGAVVGDFEPVIACRGS